MKRPLFLFSLFVLLPAVELAVLLQVGKLLGVWATVGLILLTGIVGSRLALREGLSVWMHLQRRLRVGQLPGHELLDGVIILVSGALLITPGIITDVAGFLGLVPVTRAVVRKLVKYLFVQRTNPSIRSFVDDTGPATWEGTPKERPSYVE